MRYQPNLIPPKSRVLPDYFKGSVYKPAKRNIPIEGITWLLGIFFFLSAIAFIQHPLLFLVNAFIGFILIPPGHHLIEKTLRFRLNTSIKTGACAMLFFLSIGLFSRYSEVDKQEGFVEQQQTEQARQAKEIVDRREAERKDSLSYHLQQSARYEKQQNRKEASHQLQQALLFASTPQEKEEVEQAEVHIASFESHDMVKAGKYQAALPQVKRLLQRNPDDPGLLYDRALCYSKTGQIQEAVGDLKQLMQIGNTAAEKLHEQINPLRKRIIGYETLCCDGTTSSARGQGACSHHQGVCDWNHPIYEEYRKY